MAKTTKKDPVEKSASQKSKEKEKKKAQKPTLVEKFQQLKGFLKDCWNELKKIQWPTPRQALGESVVVLITVFFITMLIMAYDWISRFLLGFILT